MYTLTDVFAGPADLYVDSKNVGWVRGGVRFRLNKGMWFRPSLSGLGVEEAVKLEEEFYVATVMVESCLENLKRAWGISEGITNPSDSMSYKRIDFGGSIAVPVHTLKFIARSKTLQVIFYRVVAMDFGEISYKREMDAFIPVTFRVLLDTSRSVGEQLGYILQGPYAGEDNLVLRLNVPKIKTDTRYCRLVVLLESTSNLVSRLSVPKIKTVQLVNRVSIFKRDTDDLEMRVSIYKKATGNLVSRVSVVYTYSSSRVISRVTVVYISGTSNLIVRLSVPKIKTVQLVNRVTVTS